APNTPRTNPILLSAKNATNCPAVKDNTINAPIVAIVFANELATSLSFLISFVTIPYTNPGTKNNTAIIGTKEFINGANDSINVSAPSSSNARNGAFFGMTSNATPMSTITAETTDHVKPFLSIGFKPSNFSRYSPS